MADIKESRLIKINNRIIMLNDLQKLCNALLREYDQLKTECEYVTIKFMATCDDQSVFESEDPCLFANDSVLSSKSVKKVSMHCTSLHPDMTIMIEINHGDSSGIFDSEVVVRGIETKCVNGTLKYLEEIVDGFTPQVNFIKKHWFIICVLFAISIGAILVHILIIVLPYISTPEPASKNNLLIKIVTHYPIMYYPILYCTYGLFGFAPAALLMERLSRLWPCIELQVGPEHKLIEKRRRVWVTGAILLGVIPMLVQLTYDIIKYFAKM